MSLLAKPLGNCHILSMVLQPSAILPTLPVLSCYPSSGNRRPAHSRQSRIRACPMDQGLCRAAIARRGVSVAGHVVRAGADLPGTGVVPGADRGNGCATTAAAWWTCWSVVVRGGGTRAARPSPRSRGRRCGSRSAAMTRGRPGFSPPARRPTLPGSSTFTFAPAVASRCAQARPIPLVAPVTTAVVPDRSTASAARRVCCWWAWCPLTPVPAGPASGGTRRRG
jgi:hypothetical protein